MNGGASFHDIVVGLSNNKEACIASAVFSVMTGVASGKREYSYVPDEEHELCAHLQWKLWGFTVTRDTSTRQLTITW